MYEDYRQGVPDARSRGRSPAAQARQPASSTGGGGTGGSLLDQLRFEEDLDAFTIPDGKGGRRPLTAADALNPKLAPYTPSGTFHTHESNRRREARNKAQLATQAAQSAALKNRELGIEESRVGAAITTSENNLAGTRYTADASVTNTNTQATSNETINAQRSAVDLYRANLESDRLSDVNDLNHDRMALENYHFQQQHNLDKRNSQRAAILSSLSQIAQGFARV